MKRTPLPKVSKKRQIENRQYEKAKREWRSGHDGRCEFRFFNDGQPAPLADILNSSRCNNPAMNQPHHTKGRLKHLSDIETFMGVCHDCHRWIDTHRKQAAPLGYFTYDHNTPAPKWTENLST